MSKKRHKNKRKNEQKNKRPSVEVFLKKDENGVGQKGIIKSYKRPIIAVYFPAIHKTRFYHFYTAFLQKNPLFETNNQELLDKIESIRPGLKCSECGANTPDLSVVEKALICDTCIKKYPVCEMCNAHVKALYDYYDLYAHKFKLICGGCLKSKLKPNPGYFWGFNENGTSFRGASILRTYGYTVDAQEGLTRDDRRCLLYSLVRNGFISQSWIADHLRFNINFHGKRDSMTAAVEKWKEDLEYMRTLYPPYKRPI